MYIELLLFLIDDDYHQHHIYRIIQHKATRSQTMNSFLFVENQFPRFPLVQPYICICYRSSSNATSTLLEDKVLINLQIGAYAFAVSTIVRNGVNQKL
jgi:hypothetical protein